MPQAQHTCKSTRSNLVTEVNESKKEAHIINKAREANSYVDIDMYPERLEIDNRQSKTGSNKGQMSNLCSAIKKKSVGKVTKSTHYESSVTIPLAYN